MKEILGWRIKKKFLGYYVSGVEKISWGVRESSHLFNSKQYAKDINQVVGGTLVRCVKKNPFTASLLENYKHTTMLLEAGQACVDWVEDTNYCHLCNYGDHDNDGGERHDDECPLRPMDQEDF